MTIPLTSVPARLPLAVVAAAFVLCGDLRAEEKANEKPTNPRQLFRLLGIGDDYFSRLADGGPIEGGETETLLRVLFRLRVFPPLDMDRWALDSEGLAEAIERPEQFRGSIFRLRGRVIEVEPCKPPVEAAQRYELTKYFRCRLQLDAADETADVYVARQESDIGNNGTEGVPAAWRKGAKLDAPGGALGVFLKLGRPSDGRATPIFAARRLAWYPDDLLGGLGMDVGLLDDVKDREPLGGGESEAFYQMLAAVGRSEPGQLLRQAVADLPKTPRAWRWTDQDGRDRYSVVPLFNEADAQRGRLVELMGTARCIEEISVDDPNIAARFGFDHYYRVSLFTDDSYDAQWNPQPLTFYVRELPAGMPYGNLPRYGETVRIAGFFFKTWAYDVPRVFDSARKSNPPTQIQFSPLLIGRGLVWRPAPKPADNTSTNVVIGAIFVAFMLIIWGLAWQNRRHARQWEKQAVGGPPTLDSGVDLDGAERRADDRPDFSRLAAMDRAAESPTSSPAATAKGQDHEKDEKTHG
jgi:hypothetical protein